MQTPLNKQTASIDIDDEAGLNDDGMTEDANFALKIESDEKLKSQKTGYPVTGNVTSRSKKSFRSKRKHIIDPPIHKTLKSIEEASLVASRGVPMTYVSRTA